MLQLDAFVNRRTKQKTKNTVTFSHFHQYELDISEYNQSHSQCYALINVKPEGGRGSGIGWGFWHFLKKIIKIPTPGRRIIVKISRNKWFTSHVLFEIDRSKAWCQVKIPTLGIWIKVKFPWVARPPPLGLDIDRCIIPKEWIKFLLAKKIENWVLLHCNSCKCTRTCK